MKFTLDTKISDAIAARPDLKVLLPAFHPPFKKLNNPILARTITKLVTVRDAARIAGVNAEAMLAVMNAPGVPSKLPKRPAARDAAPRPDWYANDLVTLLDVRPMMERAEEPFGVIMDATRALPEGEILELQTSFEPVPLLRILNNAGWDDWVRWEADACHVALRRREVREATDGEAEAVLTRHDAGATLDVSMLEPPEPLARVLETLEDPSVLPLTVVHHRTPHLLFPHLQKRGLAWSVREDERGVEVIIRRERA